MAVRCTRVSHRPLGQYTTWMPPSLHHSPVLASFTAAPNGAPHHHCTVYPFPTPTAALHAHVGHSFLNIAPGVCTLTSPTPLYCTHVQAQPHPQLPEPCHAALFSPLGWAQAAKLGEGAGDSGCSSCWSNGKSNGNWELQLSPFQVGWPS